MSDERSEDDAAKIEVETSAESSSVAPAKAAPSNDHADRIFSRYGIASAALAVVAVVAAVVAGVIFVGQLRDYGIRHFEDASQSRHDAKALQAAADWVSVLVNMSKDDVTTSMQKLHEGTVGQLNADFDATIAPFTQLVQKLQTKTVGQVDSVAIEALHHPPPGQEGKPPAQPELLAVASSTTPVMVVATSVSQSAGGKPQVVRWFLRLGVSEVDGKLLISRLETLR